jgi:hypothetical protein
MPTQWQAFLKQIQSGSKVDTDDQTWVENTQYVVTQVMMDIVT